MNELPSNAMSMLRLMPSRDVEVARFSKQIIEAVKSGNANPLEVLIMLRSLEAVSELVRDEIEENIKREAEKYSEKKFDAFGALVEKADFGKYDYTTSNDPEWERLNTDFETAKARKAEREAFLRNVNMPITAVNEDTGEVYTIRQPVKKCKEGVRVYLKHV